MGITIHWKGETDSRETADNVISYVKFFADSLGWPNEYIKYKSIADDYFGFIYNDSIDSDRAKKIKALNNINKEEGETEGIRITLPKPFNTEIVDILFYPWHGKLRMDGFCKTQVYNDEELPNLIAHQLITSMLLTIKNTWMPDLDIYDEGEYYLPITQKERAAYIKDIPKEEQKYYKDLLPFNFKRLIEAHGENLNLINKTADLFKKVDGMSFETPAKKSFIEDIGENAENEKKKRLHS
ncbi:MAG: hypothetical protein QXN16_00540 [Candidatus Micrarchaeaceae archaeon]